MSDSASRRKHALLIGINEYPNLSSFAQLEGCVNDVQLMGRLLKGGFGFPEDNVTVMANAEATRDGILKALDALAERVGTNDIVVVHYAGHGSQITDLEGDEPDGLDETIVPYDAVRTSGPNTDITDDEIHAWILRVTEKTPFLTLLFDCCHSGTITRDDFGAKARSLEPDLRPAEALDRAPFTAATTRSTSNEEGPSGWLPLSKRYVLIAGCRDEESSYEYHDIESDAKHGALTFFLGRALTEATPGTTYRDVYERVRPSVTAHSSKQHPQMEGALDRELFGIHDIEPMQFASVETRNEQAVTLAAGAAHGLSVGSEWAVYPAGTKKVEDDTPVLGRVRITEVGAVTSQAELVEETGDGAIAVGTRAVVASHTYGDLVLRVSLQVSDDEAKQRITNEIEDDALLNIVENDKPSDVRLYLASARTEVSDSDPVPQLGTLAQPTWAAVGADGRLVCPPHAASEAGVEATMCENLHKVAHYRIALALDNPDATSELRGTIDVTIKRLVDGTWIDAEPEEAGGEIVFEEGERMAFTVTNNHTEPVFINALDFGLANAVQPLTMPGANEELSPGKTQEVGLPRGIPLKFPPTFPFVQEPGDDVPAEGTETLKVFVTSKPTDFSSLQQESVRSLGAGGSSSLTSLLRHTFKGTPMRDMDLTGEDDESDDWTTVLRTFVLRRKTTGTSLAADGAGVELGGITIRTRGLDGQARVLPSPTFSARTRSVEHVTDDLDAVLDQEHVGTQQTVEIQEVRTRSLSADEDTGAGPEIEIEVPAVEGQGQFMLYTDEAGVTTWQFPEPNVATRSVDGTGTQTFIIRRAEPVPPAGATTRGLIGAVGSKLIKLLVFPLIDPIIGKVGDYYAEKWEGVNRPYGLRPFTPENFQTPEAKLGNEDWRRLGEGRSLLFVHGTFSRAHSAFGGLGAETLAELGRQYEGRVFAFDHFTLSHDPKANIEWFFEHIPDAAKLDLDIVCHSRGGLVSRMLAEKQSAFSLGSRSLDVGKVVFVASPNAGTHLADPKHMGDLVDTYTNLLNFIPDNPVTDVLDGVITVAKQLAVGALGGLEGLQSMRPGGEFQQWLNVEGERGETEYFALGADFTPSEPGFKKWAMERLTRSIFGADNDLVVPTASVYDTNGSGYFPIEERHVFDAQQGISHTTFFQDRAAQQKILEWLHA